MLAALLVGGLLLSDWDSANYGENAEPIDFNAGWIDEQGNSVDISQLDVETYQQGTSTFTHDLPDISLGEALCFMSKNAKVEVRVGGERALGIAYGCALASETEGRSVKAAERLADERMYACKKRMKGQG